MTLLLDSNVLLDIFTGDPRWADWSVSCIQPFADRPGSLLINGVIYAEIAARSTSQAMLDSSIAGLGIRVTEPSRTALFRAGQAFAAYRHRGGPRTAILPDFVIGAHAAELRVALVTRDARRYRTYFPDLESITL